ncbi:MAG: hypothetical protein QM805_16830 [Pseudomonas sp.]
MAAIRVRSDPRKGHADCFEQRLGEMAQAGSRHACPLVAVYAERFAGRRSALIGDAAIGMHPITAHGFNIRPAGGGAAGAAPAALRRFNRRA